MENIDNVIFYPLYKTFGPILVTLISIFYFSEILTFKEGLGIILGICIPLLLISTTENKLQKNLKLGLIFMGMTAIIGAIPPVFVKLSNNAGFDTVVYIFFSFLFGILFSFIGYNIEKKSVAKNTQGIAKFGIIIGILHFMTFYAYVRAFEGNIAIAFTINSFAILIPIILSIIFYGEHFNLKKGIVIALSIVSILLFI
ncbi:EamA family transporter [Candidatus Gracilibacteria bacterium]|nr:EamA family transporter [Candidatus Gracilibacteria bacterium]